MLVSHLRPRASWSLVALVAYLLLAMALLSGSLFSGGNAVTGVPGDPSIFIWSLAWVPYALSHHLDPLVTTYQHYPSGANLMWNTSIVFPSLVASPITVLGGPTVSYNILVVAATAASAW